MTISIKSPTSTTGSIQKNGSDVITIDASDNVTVANDLTVSGTISGTGTSQWSTSGSNISYTTGNVGIGTSSPAGYAGATLLNIYGTSSPGQLILEGGAGTNFLTAYSGSSAGDLPVIYYNQGLRLGKATSKDATGFVEAMRINSSGSLLIKCTANPSSSVFGSAFIDNGVGASVLHQSTSLTSANALLAFYNPNGNVGSIYTSGSSTGYATSSDYRLKESVVPMSGSIDRLKQLKPSTWSWKTDGSHGEGFLAHEAQAVVPEAVAGTKDAMKTEEYEVTPAVLDDDGNVVTEAVKGTREVPDYQGIDQSKLVPLLTAALQEAIQRIEALEAK